MEQVKDKILIIDDDKRNIFALNAVLRAKKYTCLSASSAQQGIKMLHNDPSIALVLMDIMMPEMDGYEAISLMKKDPQLQNVPVIAVTAQAMVGDREKCLEAGASGYISKPINIDELILQIKTLFN